MDRREKYWSNNCPKKQIITIDKQLREKEIMLEIQGRRVVENKHESQYVNRVIKEKRNDAERNLRLAFKVTVYKY